jgi:hypothetical protein
MHTEQFEVQILEYLLATRILKQQLTLVPPNTDMISLIQAAPSPTQPLLNQLNRQLTPTLPPLSRQVSLEDSFGEEGQDDQSPPHNHDENMEFEMLSKVLISFEKPKIDKDFLAKLTEDQNDIDN